MRALVTLVACFSALSASCAFSPTIASFKGQTLLIRTRDVLPSCLSPTKRRSCVVTQLNMNAGATEALKGAWSSYTSVLRSNPLLTKCITAGIIVGAADLTGQIVERKKKGESARKGINTPRVFRFALLGFALQSPWNHYWFKVLDRVLPPTSRALSLSNAAKVLLDQFGQAPIFTALIFLFLGSLEGKTLKSIKRQLRADYKETLYTSWKLWIPATIVNIAFCPPRFRVLYVNVVFFFWSIYLSLQLNKEATSDVNELNSEQA